MVTTNSFVRNVKHLEEESQILNVVSVLIVVDVEPEHGVGLRVLVSNLTSVVSGWNQNGGNIGSRTFRWHQTKVVVALHVPLLQLIEVLNTVKTEFLQIFLDIIGGKVGDVSWFRLAHLLSGNEVIRLAQNLFKIKRKLRATTSSRKRSNTQ